MAKRKVDPNLSLTDLERILPFFDEQRPACFTALRLGMSKRDVRRAYRKFSRGWQPPGSAMLPTFESTFYGPVPKRPVPAPNAMPWATKERLMGQRA